MDVIDKDPMDVPYAVFPDTNESNIIPDTVSNSFHFIFSLFNEWFIEEKGEETKKQTLFNIRGAQTRKGDEKVKGSNTEKTKCNQNWGRPKWTSLPLFRE